MTTASINENKIENLKEIKELIKHTFKEVLEIDLDPALKSELCKKINHNYHFDNLILNNLNKFIEACIEKRLNKKVTEETEKYEECLKKLESDIRKHIRIENEMKLHIDCFEEKLVELEYFKEENLNLREKLKDYKHIKSENISFTNKLKQSEDNLQKMNIKVKELEEKAKYVKGLNENIPISIPNTFKEFKIIKLPTASKNTSVFNYSTSLFAKSKTLTESVDKIIFRNGNSRGNPINNLKTSIFNTSKDEVKYMSNKSIATSIDRRIDKTINISSISKNNFNLKDPFVREKLKSVHIPSKSFNKESLNLYLSSNILKSKINLK